MKTPQIQSIEYIGAEPFRAVFCHHMNFLAYLLHPLRVSGLWPLCRAVCAATVACLGLAASPALAQDAPYDRVERWLKAGELALALNEAQTWLTKHPRDPQMRFLSGVILKQRGDLAAARETFSALTRDFPELPEPYNNLAVLEAAEGRLAEARQALEMAIRLHPTYATAHRNLGDLWLRMAAESYRSALLHGGGTPADVQHLQAVERLLPPSSPSSPSPPSPR